MINRPYGIKTRDDVDVLVGQVWRDLDPRVNRTVTVQRVDDYNGVAHVISSRGAKSSIRIDRMHRHRNGFELVTEAK